VQVQAFQQRDREEEDRLIAGRPGKQSPAAGPLLGEVDQRPGRCDVRVEFGVVGMGVVPVVLVQPPPDAQAYGEVAVQETEQIPMGLQGG
jgi:hypothetical protein